MEAITKTRQALNSLRARAGIEGVAAAVIEAAAIFILAMHHDLWPVAIVVVSVIELGLIRPGDLREVRDWAALVRPKLPLLLVGAACALIVAILPRVISQLVVAAFYLGWRVWWGTGESGAGKSLPGLLVASAVIFEAIFLIAAVWRAPSNGSWTEFLVLALVWGGAYGSVYSVLSNRGEKAAGVMAATWAVICAEITWVLIRWLFTYTVTGGYLLVPQPVVILTALAYCFGSIYVLQRQGHLSRGRLTEYLLIGLILIAIVITGTPWRGSL